MANGAAHQVAAASIVGAGLFVQDQQRDELTLKPVVGAALAAATTNLPDWLEPATNPHHRQFFHGVVFACALGYGAKRLYDWKPTEPHEKALRFGLLVFLAAYFIHLALDSGTARSLPLLGKI